MYHKMSGESEDVTKANSEKLAQLFPEVVTEDGRIDFDQLRMLLGEAVEQGSERYSFSWNGKKEALLGAQKPSKGTLRPLPDKSKDFDTTQNLYIEGDNLEVLKLLQKSYNNKIKMIYIDPPYNTGKDFVYKDNFAKGVDNYLEQTGQVDAQGNRLTTNTESNGRFHSDWLNMIYPRLKLARNLLKEHGVIFISIDDHEQSNLIKVCDEIFGQHNFVANLVWANKEGGGSSDSRLFRIKHEYIVCYAKSIEKLDITGVAISNEDRYKQKDEHETVRGPYYLQKLGMGSIQYSPSLDYAIEAPDGTSIYPADNNNGKKACWRWSEAKFKWGVENDFVVIQKDSKGVWTVYTKQYLKMDNDGNVITRTQRPLGIIEEYSSTQASKFLDHIGMGNVFDYSKPVRLIEYLIDRVLMEENDIVLDFFSGSATTAHAVMKRNAEDGKNRRFILVQLPEPLTADGYRTICDIGEERIRRSGEKVKEEMQERMVKAGLLSDGQLDPEKLDTGFKVLKLDQSNIREWNTDFDHLEDALDLFEEVFVDGRSELDIVYEMMLKNGLELTSSVTVFHVDGRNVYDVAHGRLFICLDDHIDRRIAEAIVEARKKSGAKTGSVIFKDSGFAGNDAEKLNCYEYLKDAGYPEDNLLSI